MPPPLNDSQNRDTGTPQKAQKACHSCRRARLRCDRLLPHCTKCTSRGVECLGYGRLFLWTGVVATRGKLAGQTSSAALCRVPKEDDNSVASMPEDFITPFENQLFYPTWPTSSPSVLVDPLFQDMDYTQRWYLNYFTSRVCQDLVAHDQPTSNPYRSLLLLTNTHPFLKQVIIAASAAHMCNASRPWLSPNSFARQEPPTNLLTDALIAKQRTLQMMPSALQNIDSIGADVILAAVLFLVNVELIESGWQGWRPHLEGAKKLLNMIQPYAAFDETLRDYIVSDCYIYCTLSLSFNPSLPGIQTTFSAPDQVYSTLSRANNIFFCCPPEILDILHEAARLLSVIGDDDTVGNTSTPAFASLLKRAQTVDVFAWAKLGFQSTNDAAIRSRFLAGSVHRLATCLYIVQSAPGLSVTLQDEACQTLIQSLYETMLPMPDDDPNFKATGWPTFIYGTTATTPESQTWAMDRLKRMATVCPWGFLYSAIETLQILWGLRLEGKNTMNWVQALRDLNVNFMMV